jgi:hypothetical protein
MVVGGNPAARRQLRGRAIAVALALATPARADDGRVAAERPAVRAAGLRLEHKLASRLGAAPGADGERTIAARLGMRLALGAPPGRSSLADTVVDRLSALGNELGDHLDTLSMALIALRIDGAGRRMQLGLGGGQRASLLLRMASDVHFRDGVARLSAHVHLCLAGHSLALRLPDLEVAPSSYRGERGVEVRLPLIEGSF